MPISFSVLTKRYRYSTEKLTKLKENAGKKIFMICNHNIISFVKST